MKSLTPYGEKTERVIFDKVDECTWKYDRTKYLRLLHSDEKCKRSFGRIRYVAMLKNNISDIYSHKYMKIKEKH